jgi:hypothetical protein
MIFVEIRYDALAETRQIMSMTKIVAKKNAYAAGLSDLLGIMVLASALAASPAVADEIHPLMTSKYWAKAGGFFASRDLSVSASGMLGPEPSPTPTNVDFESQTGLDDKADLGILEFGWQFAKKWDFALQHFRSSRSTQRELSESIEWEDVVYEVGARVDARSYMRTTRLFLSRRVWDKGPHDLRLGLGVHLLDIGVSLSGEATLEDETSEFYTSVVSADFPFPDIGAWYRYSNSDRWVFHARVDWLSASTSDYSGGIWNASAGVDFALSKHFGMGIAYQFFELNGSIKEDNWRGDIVSRHEGLTFNIAGFW